jgi:adenosylcobinamide-GDP ribazoletransferase
MSRPAASVTRPAVRLAVGTVTVLRAGPVEVTPAVAGQAMALAPLAVLPVAAAAGAAAWAASAFGLPVLVVGLAAVTALALGTRGLHLDGLADTVDGLASGWDSERALAVMKRGDVGPMGVVALVVVVAAQAALLGALADGWPGAVLIAAVVCVSRCAIPVVCARGVPAARLDGLGAAVAGTVPRPVAAGCWLVGLAVLGGALALAGRPWWPAAPAVVAALLSIAALLARTRRRFGGMTGDVIGAGVELALLVLLVGIWW